MYSIKGPADSARRVFPSYHYTCMTETGAFVSAESAKEKRPSERGPVALAATAGVLGVMMGLGFASWRAIHPPSLCALPLYLSLVATFHFVEFLVVHSARAPDTGSRYDYEAFLLDNGNEYILALSAPVIEFMVEWLVFPWGKTVRIFRLLGLLLAAAGLGLRCWTIVHMKNDFSHYVLGLGRGQQPLEPGHRLITDGPFKYCRHPAYTGFAAWAVGLQVLLANPVCAAWYCKVLIEFFQERIGGEERALVERFGTSYLDYRRKTPSGIPLVP